MLRLDSRRYNIWKGCTGEYVSQSEFHNTLKTNISYSLVESIVESITEDVHGSCFAEEK